VENAVTLHFYDPFIKMSLSQTSFTDCNQPVYWTKSQWTTKPDWFRWAFFTSIRGWSPFTCYFSALWKGDKRSWDIFLWNNSGRHHSFV